LGTIPAAAPDEVCRAQQDVGTGVGLERHAWVSPSRAKTY